MKYLYFNIMMETKVILAHHTEHLMHLIWNDGSMLQETRLCEAMSMTC